MAAFEPILSGIPGLDRCLDSIRLGDNVVWQVSDLDAFRTFAKAFAEQAVRDGRNILYIRFAGHDPILPAMPGVREVHMPLSHLFESFTVDIHNLIEREGRDAFYVFDCLSELEEAWATDLMMGNFFHLTCPFLFSLDTVAYFPILRGRHSFDAIDIIANTTQLFLDVFPGSVVAAPQRAFGIVILRLFRAADLAHMRARAGGMIRRLHDDRPLAPAVRQLRDGAIVHVQELLRVVIHVALADEQLRVIVGREQQR